MRGSEIGKYCTIHMEMEMETEKEKAKETEFALGAYVNERAMGKCGISKKTKGSPAFLVGGFGFGLGVQFGFDTGGHNGTVLLFCSFFAPGTVLCCTVRLSGRFPFPFRSSGSSSGSGVGVRAGNYAGRRGKPRFKKASQNLYK